jgi:hypothetical protein
MKRHAHLRAVPDLGLEIEACAALAAQQRQPSPHSRIVRDTTPRGPIRRDRTAILDLAVLDDDLASHAGLGQQQPGDAPSGQRRDGVEAARESGALMVDVRRERGRQHEAAVGVGLDTQAEPDRQRDLRFERGLELSQAIQRAFPL